MHGVLKTAESYRQVQGRSVKDAPGPLHGALLGQMLGNRRPLVPWVAWEMMSHRLSIFFAFCTPSRPRPKQELCVQAPEAPPLGSADYRMRGQSQGLKRDCQELDEICDLVLFSKVSVRFTLERIMHRVGSHVVTIWASDECISETSEAGAGAELASPSCTMLHH